MSTIRFLPDDRSIFVPVGTTILEGARSAGVTIEAPCNGAGTCGKCRVLVTDGELASLRLPDGSGPFPEGEGPERRPRLPRGGPCRSDGYGTRPEGGGAQDRRPWCAGGEVEIGVIGGGKATGICGSGLIDIVAELVRAGVIGLTGRFVSSEKVSLPKLRERLGPRDGKPVFHLSDGVFLSQQDIRQVQLAKGAIRAGIDLLLRHLRVKAGEVRSVLIAGSFGYHLRAESLITLGLLPPEFAGKIEFVGNTSKTGAESILLDQECRAEVARFVAEVDVVELAAVKGFDKAFVASLGF